MGLVLQESFPSLNILKPEVSVFGGVTLQLTDTQLLTDGEVAVEWSDKFTEKCQVTLSLNGREVKSGETISEPGKLTLTVTNNQGKSSSAEITLTNDTIIGLENLKSIAMQVDVEVDLLQGLTFTQGVELTKTEIEFDDQRVEIADPMHFSPEYPGACALIFSVKRNEAIGEVKAEDLAIKPLDYKAIEVTDIKPVNILPII